jgi:transposase
MRKGMGGLTALVQTSLQADPFCGHLFVFRGRRGDLVKVLWWSGDGMCLFVKRLERGRFVWPRAMSGSVVLSAAQLSMLACPACERMVQIEAPSRPIARGLAGAGLLAHVLVSKYCDHLPLYRQAQIYAREGVELERSTLADWVGGCFHLLDPLVESLARYVMAAEKLHADDTPVPVLDPGRGRTKTGPAVDLCSR